MSMCRACLVTEITMIPMDEAFVDDYNSLTNLKITLLDEMPHQVCKPCKEVVAQFIAFREKCVTSEYSLQNSSMKIEVEPKQEPVDDDIKEEKYDVDDTTYDDCINEVFTDFEDDNMNLFLKSENEETTEPEEKKSKGNRKKTVKNIKTPTKFKDAQEDLMCETTEQIIRKSTRKKTNVKEPVVKKTKKDEQVEKKLMCGICIKNLDNQAELQAHLDKHKNDDECEICKEHFSNWPMLLSHRITHLPMNDWLCHMCTKKPFKSVITLEFHYRTVHNEGESTELSCKYCLKSFITPAKLKKHIYRSHTAPKSTCDICKKVFNNKTVLKIHLRTHSEQRVLFKCEKCDFSCTNNFTLKNHVLRKHTANSARCPGCRKVFASKQDHDEHNCTAKTKVCPVCGIQLPPNMRMDTHMYRHRQKKLYQCDRCPSTFKTSGNLRIHKDRHDGNRSQKCEFCPATFYSPTTLIKHRRTHTGEKPYVCKICQKGFTANHNLKVHMKVHGLNMFVNRDAEIKDGIS